MIKSLWSHFTKANTRPETVFHFALARAQRAAQSLADAKLPDGLSASSRARGAAKMQRCATAQRLPFGPETVGVIMVPAMDLILSRSVPGAAETGGVVMGCRDRGPNRRRWHGKTVFHHRGGRQGVPAHADPRRAPRRRRTRLMYLANRGCPSVARALHWDRL